MLPPQNIDAEEAVLGAVLLSEKTLYTLTVDIDLKPEDFYRPSYGDIFRAMLALQGAGDPVDKLTVQAHLQHHGLDAGGAAEIEALAAAPPVVGNVRQYGKIVKDAAISRAVIGAAWDILERADTNPEAGDLLDEAERAMTQIRGAGSRRREYRSIDAILEDELESLAAIGDQKLTGTPSGFTALDEVTGGFQPGNLIVLAARPGMGKSALAANFAEHAAVREAIPTLLFTLEMSESELSRRFIASLGAIPGDDLRRGRANWERVAKTVKAMGRAPLFVDDSSDLSIRDLRSKARKLAATQPLGLIVVDYLQLMRPEGRSDNVVEQIGAISKGLKTLARELSVPIVALSQLSRAVEHRQDKRPMLADLRSSGQIEQDADLVMFIYREDYYDADFTGEGDAELMISKHRNGALGNVPLLFQTTYPRFVSAPALGASW